MDLGPAFCHSSVLQSLSGSRLFLVVGSCPLYQEAVFICVCVCVAPPTCKYEKNVSSVAKHLVDAKSSQSRLLVSGEKLWPELFPDSFISGDFTFIICIIGVSPAWLMCRVALINRSHSAYKFSSPLHLGPWRKA